MAILLVLVSLCLGRQGNDPLALLGDPDPDRRVRGVRMIARENSLRAAKVLLALHEDPHPRVRRKALEALAEVSDPVARSWVIDSGLSHRKAPGREMAARAVGWMEARGAVPHLRPLLRDEDAGVRAAAVEALGRLGAPEAADEVARRLDRDRTWRVRAEAASALARISPEEASPHLRKALRDRDPRVRVATLEAIERVSRDEARAEAIDRLRDDHWSVRCTATQILTRVGGKEAVGPLIEALEAAEGRTTRDAMQALGRITGRRLGADPVAWRTWWEAHGPSWTGPTGPAGREPGRSSLERVTYYGIPIWSERVVFVIDLSESMGEPAGADGSITRADQARRELGDALAGLPDTSRFNVIRFRSKPEVLSPRPLSPARPNRAASLRWIDAPGGGTNIHDALEMAIAAGGGDTVFLLTDGAPSCGTYRNKTEILESVGRMNRFRKVRIHAIGIGSQAVSERWRGLLDRLAASTDGEFVIRE